MPSASDRLEFTPPPQPALVRAFFLALLAHLLLIAALTWGVKWKRDNQDMAAEAELWSSVPQQAAPKEVAPPPPPPQPVVKETPRPPEPEVNEAEIALEKEKQRKALEAKRREQEEIAREKKELEARRKEEAQKKLEAQKLAAEKQRKEDADRKRRQEQDAQKIAKLREENLRRIQGMAGASGGPTSTGTAARSSGPSASWGAKVRARVKPNIVFSEDVAGNPEALVEVRLAPDGTIVGKRITKPSGLRSWDDAVMRALDKTEVLPRDVDGRVPPSVELAFRPRD